MNKNVWILIVLFGLFAVTLPAQSTDDENSKVGLVFMGSGSANTLLSPTIGAIWHLNNHIAFSPYINFANKWRNWDINLGSLDPNNKYYLATGAKLQLYLKKWNKVRLYVAPGYEFTREHILSPTNDESRSREYNILIHDHAVFVLGGVHYVASNRISLLGDMGLEYKDRNQMLIEETSFHQQAVLH